MEREIGIQKKQIGDLTTDEISSNLLIPTQSTTEFYLQRLKEYEKREKEKLPLIYKTIKREDFEKELQNGNSYISVLAKTEKSLKQDHDEMLKQIEKYPEAILYADEKIKTKDFLKESIERNPQAYSYLTKEEKQDADLTRAYRDSLFSEKNTKFDYVTQDGIKGRQIKFQIDKDVNKDIFFEKDAMIKAYDELIREPFDRGMQRKSSYMFVVAANAFEKDSVEYLKEAARKYSPAIEQTIIQYKRDNSKNHGKDILNALTYRDAAMKRMVNEIHENAEVLKNRTYRELEQRLSIEQNRPVKETPSRLQTTEEQEQILDKAMEDKKLKEKIEKTSMEAIKNEAKAILYSEYLNGQCSQTELSEGIGRINSINDFIDKKEMVEKLATVQDVVQDFYNQKYGEEINGFSVYDKVVDKDRNGLPDYQQRAEDYSKAYHDEEFTHSPEEKEMYHKYSYKG